MESVVPILLGLGSAACGLLGLVVVAVAGFLVLRRLGTQGAPGAAPSRPGSIDTAGLQAMYTETLGYRSQETGNPAHTHMVREAAGHEVHLETETEQAATGVRVSWTWSTPSASALRVHVVERGVADPLSRSVRDGARGRARTFTPAWPAHFPTGDAELDGRFRVFAPTPAHAAQAVSLRAALLALAHVELTASDAGVRLSDPFQDNLLARMGGPMGMAQIATARGIAVQVQLHEQAAALLRGAVEA